MRNKTEACNEGSCSPSYESWTQWTSCGSSCVGQRTRTRCNIQMTTCFTLKAMLDFDSFNVVFFAMNLRFTRQLKPNLGKDSFELRTIVFFMHYVAHKFDLQAKIMFQNLSKQL